MHRTVEHDVVDPPRRGETAGAGGRNKKPEYPRRTEHVGPRQKMKMALDLKEEACDSCFRRFVPNHIDTEKYERKSRG